eukprot:COSAG06_NODE_887_length_11768_cov_28.624732_8_plen_69_part_00
MKTPSLLTLPATGISPIAFPSESVRGNASPFNREDSPNTPGGSSGKGDPAAAAARAAAFGSADSVQYV